MCLQKDINVLLSYSLIDELKYYFQKKKNKYEKRLIGWNN